MKDEQDGPRRDDEVATTHGKRRYHAPKIVDSAQFETLALTCGKVGGLACVLAGGLSNS